MAAEHAKSTPYRRHLLIPLLQSTGSRNAPAWVSNTVLYGDAKHVRKLFAGPSPSCHSSLLANWNWGGRLHPLYYNLSIATKALLGLAIMICRLVVLRHSEHEEDQHQGFVGNTILLAQPRPQDIMQTLPPQQTMKCLTTCRSASTVRR